MSIATPPFAPPRPLNGPEPSWEVVKLFPLQGHWSESEYLSLETNRLVELAEGNIKVLEMATTDHQDIVGFLYRRLFSFAEARQSGKVNFAPLPVKLWEGTMREPERAIASSPADKLKQIVVIPSSIEAFGFNSVLEALVLLE